MMKCPRCATVLNPVIYDGQNIEVCPQCQGEWLSSEELGKIVEHHDEVFTPAEIASIKGVNRELFTAEKDDHDELDCPHCGEQMEHFNYGETSGVILHKCHECDGIWMDKDELRKVEILVDGWKDALADDEKKYGPILAKVEKQEDAELDKNVSISKFGFVNAILRRFCE
jgi:Zn-finger nucleic acid-binding protein